MVRRRVLVNRGEVPGVERSGNKSPHSSSSLKGITYQDELPLLEHEFRELTLQLPAAAALDLSSCPFKLEAKEDKGLTIWPVKP